MELVKQNKVALVSDVGQVSVTRRPKRVCTNFKNDDADCDLEENDLSNSFVDFESSGSEFIPPSRSSSSEFDFDLDGLGKWDESDHNSDGNIPFQPNFAIADEGLSTSIVLQSLENIDNGNIEHNVLEPINLPLSSENTAEVCTTSTIIEKNKNYYTKKQSAKERPTICPICFNDVVTHFTRHLFRHHGDNKDVKLLKSFKPRSKERLNLVASLRKQGYFHLNVEKGVLNPVRTSKNPNTDYFVYTYCLGHYSKKLLYKHVKRCKNKPPDLTKAGNNCLTKSQTFMAAMTSKNHDFLKTSRIKAEVLNIMRPDNISAVAKSDPIICLYGEMLLNKHKRQQIATVISNKIREMARLLIVLKSFNTEIDGLFDALKPEMFQHLVSATKIVSGFNVEDKTFKSPSLALHMGSNLKLMCDVAFKIVVEKRNIPKIKWIDREEKKKEIKELKKLIMEHWCNELSSLALKSLKENHWEKPVELPLTSSIQTFQSYLNSRADDAYDQLSTGQLSISLNYKVLTECVLTLTVMFNRKRVGDVQYLKIETYEADKSTSNQEAFEQSLTAVEKLISKKFKRVVTGGKGSRPVPILFSTRLQKFISCLIDIRKNSDIVPKSNPYLFANPKSENRWMSGTNVIRRLAKDSGVKNPGLLTSTKFRKHIATTLQLMSMEDNEMEQVASFMGHTKKTHAEFYRLPQDIYQTVKVAKVLLLLEKGKGKEFKGKNLNDIELQKDIYYSSESDCDEQGEESMPLSERILNRNALNLNADEFPLVASTSQENTKNKKKKRGIVKQGQPRRRRWSDSEKKTVLKYFQNHIKKKITQKKNECEELLSQYPDLKDKGWIKIKTLVYNSFRQK